MRVALFLLFLSIPAHSFIDSSSDPFFPKDVSQNISKFKSFPISWWNLLVVKPLPKESVITSGQKLCEILNGYKDDIRLTGCPSPSTQIQAAVKDWARDIVFRTPRPTDKALIQSMKTATAQWALLIGPQSKWIGEILRVDPLQSHKDLQLLTKPPATIRLGQFGGFYFDEEKNRLILPVQLGFSPTESERTQSFLKTLGEHFSVDLYGPHWSTIENKSQVMSDVQKIGWLGPLSLLLGLLLLFFFKRGAVIWLLPPVFFGTIVGGIITYFVFGSLHGLALSFGIGIIGLSLDYGFHAIVHKEYRLAWRSNAIGLITTLTVLVTLLFSQIELIRQLMLFSITGLTISFILLYYITKSYSQKIRITSFSLPVISRSIFKLPILFFLLPGLMLFLFGLEKDFDFRQFNYQSKNSKEIHNWISEKTNMQTPLFEIIPSLEKPSQYLEQKTWSRLSGVYHETPLKYLPIPSLRKIHYDSWYSECDNSFISKLSKSEKTLFKPFLDNISCEGLEASLSQINSTTPLYMSHLNHNGEWIQTWLPQNEETRKMLKARYPKVQSLYELVSGFSKALSDDILRLGPIALFLVILISFLFFQKLSLTFYSLIPTFSAFALIGWYFYFTSNSLTFISFVGLIMVFGLSIDYGIFITQELRHKGNQKELLTAISLAAATTFLGFYPLLLCSHPVLIDLGLTLVIGVIGTYLGAWIVFPALLGKKINSNA